MAKFNAVCILFNLPPLNTHYTKEKIYIVFTQNLPTELDEQKNIRNARRRGFISQDRRVSFPLPAMLIRKARKSQQMLWKGAIT